MIRAHLLPLFLFVVIFGTALTLPAHHAFGATEVTTGGIFGAQIAPQNPGPNTEITVTLSSFVDDFKRSAITWSVNGKEVLRGTGEDVLSTKTGGAGEKMTIQASINTPTETQLKKIITLIPAGLEVTWEADTSTPPLYRGKKIPSHEATINLVATVTGKTTTGKTLTNDDLIFTWSNDGKELSSSSGKGRFSAKITAPAQGEETLITLKVASPDNTISSAKTVSIPLTDPFILFYENRPLQGLSPIALGQTLRLSESEVTLRAEPYFFSGRAEALQYAWTLGGAPTDPNQLDARSLTLRQEGGYGESRLGILVRHGQKLFQEARATINIVFGTR